MYFQNVNDKLGNEQVGIAQESYSDMTTMALAHIFHKYFDMYRSKSSMFNPKFRLEDKERKEFKEYFLGVGHKSDELAHTVMKAVYGVLRINSNRTANAKEDAAILKTLEAMHLQDVTVINSYLIETINMLLGYPIARLTDLFEDHVRKEHEVLSKEEVADLYLSIVDATFFNEIYSKEVN